jgi:hypothetical protein
MGCLVAAHRRCVWTALVVRNTPVPDPHESVLS